MKKKTFRALLKAAMLASAAQIVVAAHAASPELSPAPAQRLATGQFITPTFIRGSVQQFLNPGLPDYPDFIAGEAVRSQLSPDGRTLAVITAGFNSLQKPDGTTDTANSTQFIFIYNVAGANKTKPVLSQVIKQTNSYVGLVFSPDGKTLYAAGGADDVVYAYTVSGSTWSLKTKIPLGHADTGLGLGVRPNSGGLDVSADGRTLVVVNNYNDSISVIDTATSTVRYEHDLRPYFAHNEGKNGGVGGTFPFGVVVKGNGTAYVSSDRDREVIVVDISSSTAGRLIKRIEMDGNALGLTLDRSQQRLYVAQDNADQIAVIDTSTNAVIRKIDARAPEGMLTKPRSVAAGFSFGRGDGDNQPHYTGAATFSATISPDGRTLYAVNAGANSIAVIPLSGPGADTVIGLIPTAYEPHDITFSADGSWMYIVNGKSVTGPNPDRSTDASNQYQFQLERASLVSAPVPPPFELPILTGKVAQNNFYSAEPTAEDKDVIRFLRERIKHVIYIVKENRTYDQVLGDLANGANGDPSLTVFGQAITPSFHSMAKEFVTLDNFNDPGDGSPDGWSWTLQGRVTNTETLAQQISYASVDRGLDSPSEAINRNVSVNLPTVAQREAAAPGYSSQTAKLPGGTANLLPGTGDHSAADAPYGMEHGYIYNAVLNAGETIRDYGRNTSNVGSIGTKTAPISDPFKSKVVQVVSREPSLVPYTDVFFRDLDLNYPDLWRYNEWKREFDLYVAHRNLPNFELVRLGEDHMGSFSTALAGVNTPETQQADNDFAVGRLVEAVAHSPYASNTLIFIVEDDSQDGPDHVDSHRAPAYVVGPYVKQHAVVSTHYSQVNVIRTIEDVLGTEHINLNTAFQRPMTEVFDIHSLGAWTYTATASTVLLSTKLKLTQGDQPVRFAEGPIVKPKHNAAYWTKVTAGFDFSDADRIPPDRYNRVIWKGMMGSKPYPKMAHNQTNAIDKDN